MPRQATIRIELEVMIGCAVFSTAWNEAGLLAMRRLRWRYSSV